jgi:hypothetical protein
MANWNPLTNAIGGGGATSHNTYYNTNPTNFGEYGYIYLTEIVDNFIAAYTGTNKILASVTRSDVNFHAHRALQELSYDTLRSVKSQEIEVCPSLKMPLPHDYVNYVKLTSLDSNGIEHVLYPARNTSNPFSINQSDGCGYDMESGELKHQSTCVASTVTECNPDTMQAWLKACLGTNSKNYLDDHQYPISIGENEFGTHETVTFDKPYHLYMYISQLIDDYCECARTYTGDESFSCGKPMKWKFENRFQQYNFIGIPLIGGWEGPPFSGMNNHSWDLDNTIFVGTLGNSPQAQINVHMVDKFLDELSFPLLEGSFSETCTFFSNTWDSYSGASGTTVGVTDTLNPAIDNSNYFTNTGERYGLEPEHAQANGSYFIDYLRGNIHFGSALAGKTITLKYISDGHGTEYEQIIPKLAEEAAYKWIAYGCAQARSDVDPGTIARFKKEKAAETRKAKLRLSNIKIEEISQVFRGKSKWIKH